MVFDHHELKEVSAELLGADGIATETIRHADIVSFTCLKSYALDQRHERKYAHGLIYRLEHYDAGLEMATKAFRAALDGKHKEAIQAAVKILKKRFTDDEQTEGYLKDGPVAVAKFDLGEDAERGMHESYNDMLRT